MAVERVGNGFLLAQDDLLSNVWKGPMIEYADPEGKFLVARWDLGGSIKINEMDGSGEWRSSDFFNFVDRDGKAWQARRIGDEFALKPLPALSPEIHAACVELATPGDHHHRSCCAPNRMQIAVNESDEDTRRYVGEFSYLDWNNAPHVAAWNDHFLVRLAGGKPAETASLELLRWDGLRQTAAWDAAAGQFRVSTP
jgi:hypothetical protein